MMKAKPISVQLYSLREESAADFPHVLERIAGMGYNGVEPAGFYGLKPEEFKAIVDDLGLSISSTHSPWCHTDNIEEVIETAKILDVKHVVCGYGADAFETEDAIKQTAETVNGMIDLLEASGICLIQHNHAWEFELLGDRLKYDIYAEQCPRILFELDLYWASNFGVVDVPAQVRKHASRTPFLHVKDGPLQRGQPMLAVGQGKMDIPECLHAADPDILQWLVVELDRHDGDMFTAVEQSFQYLTEQGFATGR